MKLVVAGQNYWIQGGADRVLMDHVSIFSQRGHICAPFVARHANNLPSEWSHFFPAGANIKSPKPIDVSRFIYSIASKKAIAKLLDELNPDAVHLHIYYGSLTSSIISEIAKRNIPLIQTLHEYKIVCPVYTASLHGESCERCSDFKFHRVLTNRCNKNSIARSAVSMIESYVSLVNGSIKRFDKFVAVSNFLREKTIRMGVPENKIVTIYNPVDAKNIQVSHANKGYFLYYGRVEREKGIMVLLEAFQSLKHLRLRIVGTGAALPEVQKYIKDNDMQHVTCVGYKSGNALAEEIKDALCTVVPSIWDETFGLTAAESMAYGKPVIASRIGGLPEVVDHQDNGLLVTPRSADKLREAINFMHANPGAVADMSISARAKVELRFSQDAYYANIMEVYQDCMRQKARSTPRQVRN